MEAGLADHDIVVATTTPIDSASSPWHPVEADACELVVDVAELGPPSGFLGTIQLLGDGLRPDAVLLGTSGPWLGRHAGAVRALFPTTPILVVPELPRPTSIEDHGVAPRSGRPAIGVARPTPAVTVVIETAGDVATLSHVLAALEAQTERREDYEVIVVAETAAGGLVRWADDPLRRLVVLPGAGVAGRRNVGLFLAASPLVLFLADDERAAPDLVTEHRRAHDHFSSLEAAVIGHTTWDDSATSPLAAWTAAADDVPLGYPGNPRAVAPNVVETRARQLSVKRAFLAWRGVFDPSFERCGDVELGLRLQLAGLDLRYWSHARSFRLGPCELDRLCDELAADGPELVRLARLDPSGLVAALVALDGASARWRQAEASVRLRRRCGCKTPMPLTRSDDAIERYRRYHDLLLGEPSPGDRRRARPGLRRRRSRRQCRGDRSSSDRHQSSGDLRCGHACWSPASCWPTARTRRRRPLTSSLPRSTSMSTNGGSWWGARRARPARERHVALPDRFVAERRTTLAPKFEILGGLLAGGLTGALRPRAARRRRRRSSGRVPRPVPRHPAFAGLRPRPARPFDRVPCRSPDRPPTARRPRPPHVVRRGRSCAQHRPPGARRRPPVRPPLVDGVGLRGRLVAPARRALGHRDHRRHARRPPPTSHRRSLREVRRRGRQRHPPGRRRPPSTRRVHALSSKSTPSPMHDPPQHPPVASANASRWCPRCVKSS